MDGLEDVCRGDTIHLVEADLGEEEENARDEWFDDDVDPHRQRYFDNNRNFIRLTYDFCLREMRIGFKAIAVKAGGCDAEAVRDYLDRNGIVFGNAGNRNNDDDNGNEEGHPQLRVRRGVFWNNELYRIAFVHQVEGTVCIVPADPDQDLGGEIISIEEALENVISGN